MKDVLSRFVEGDEAAFEQLFRQFEADVHGWILRIVRDPAASDDVLVDAFWRAYRGRAQFDPGRSFGAWMRRIATNAALDHLRAVSRRREAPPADDRVPAPAGSDRDTQDAITGAFRGLPADLQLVAALPPVAMAAPAAPQPRARDLWPSIVERAHQRPRWSVADWSVAAMVVVALLMFPEWFWFLAYHL